MAEIYARVLAWMNIFFSRQKHTQRARVFTNAAAKAHDHIHHEQAETSSRAVDNGCLASWDAEGALRLFVSSSALFPQEHYVTA